MWTASELRRRWMSLVVLGVLGGVAAGLALASYDGAQRSGNAYRRMRDELHAADVVLFPSQIEIGDFDAAALEELPEVESWGGFSLNPSSIDGVPLGSPLITSGDDWFERIEGAKVLEGRLPDPGNEREVVVTEPVLDDLPQLELGSTMTWRNLSVEQAAELGFEPPPEFDWTTAAGPVTQLEVVGIVRMPIESVAAFANDGLLLTSPAWAAAHFDDVPILFTNAIVRLRNGEDDLPALRASIARLTGRSDVPVKDLATDIKRVQRSLDIERTALLMFSATVAVTALVLVGQATVRATASGAVAVTALRAMGASSAALGVGLAAPMLATLASAVAVAGVVGVVATHWFPVGLARRVDTDAGIHLDLSRLVGGLVLTGLVAALVIGAAAVVLQRPTRARRSSRTLLMSWATKAGVNVTTALGASLALDAAPSRAPRSRLAIIASVAGVVAVIAALTIVHAIDDTVEHPERTGANWDFVVAGGGIASEQAAIDAVAGEPGIAAMAFEGHRATDVGGFDVPVYGLDVKKGVLDFTVTRGAPPQASDEIALGPATMRLLDAEVGDVVAVGPAERPMSVVGVALLTQQPHSSFDEGGWVTAEAYASIAEPRAGTVYDELLITIADGADADSVAARLPPHWQLSVPSDSADVDNLVQVRRLPMYLAGFVALLALGAVAHALFTGVRERAKELAVLRALGVTARQAGASVTWQAIVTAVIAVVAGVPIGVLVGRRVWRTISDELSFVYVGPLATAVLAIAVPACLLACLLLAIYPARGTARRPITETLRQE
jgi:ABC-type lipoprotein release transport system permease subunit